MKKKKFIPALLLVTVLALMGCAEDAVDYTASSEEIVVPEEDAIPDAATAVEKIMNNEDVIEIPDNEDTADADDDENEGTAAPEADDSVKEQSDHENAAGEDSEEKNEDVSGDQTEAESGMEVTLYYVQGDFDNFKTDTADLETLTPEGLVAELAAKNIFPMDTRVNSFEIVTTDMGTEIAELDITDGYETFVSTMSVEAELAVINSVADTFISAYGTDAFRLTVNGSPVRSRNLNYDSNFCFTDDPQAISMSEEVQMKTFD